MTDEAKVDDLLLMGRMWKAHGLQGEVKMIPETDDPSRLEDLPSVFVGRTPETARLMRVEQVRYQTAKKGTLIILKLESVADRDQAEEMRGLRVFVRKEDMPSLADDEVFLHDLVGLRAVLEDGEEVGLVDNVMELPAQALLVIARKGREPAMIPAVAEFVVDIDLDAGRVVIRPIEGLLDD